MSKKNLLNQLDTLRHDLPASLVVFLVAVPLCLGIALASGAPLVSGLVAGIVGGIVVGALSGSALGVSGPAAGLAVIVLSAINELGSFEVFLVAVILAGALQIAFGFAKAGITAYYFPSSVITGMLSGIGVIIFLKQIPHALGYDGDAEGNLAFRNMDGENTLSALLRVFDLMSTGPLLIAAASLAVLLLWESRWLKGRAGLSLLPGPLVAVILGAALQWLFRHSPSLALRPSQLVHIPVAEGLSGLSDFLVRPDFSALGNPAVYATAVVLAVVASLETLLSVEASDKLDPLKRTTPTNRELKAQGIGNIISGLLGGLPVTQVVVRSSANVQSGGRSKVSAIAHGLLLLGSVAAIPTLLNMIPLATLAAVLLLVGYKLARPSTFRRMFQQGPGQFAPFMVTVLGIVFTDLLTGIVMGFFVAVSGILLENYRLPFEMRRLDTKPGSRVRIALAQQVTFLNKASILTTLSAIGPGTHVRIDASTSRFVHRDVIEMLDDFLAGAAARGITVELVGIEPHRSGGAPWGMDLTVETPTAADEQRRPRAA